MVRTEIPTQENILARYVLRPLDQLTIERGHSEMRARYDELAMDWPAYNNPEFHPDLEMRTWPDGRRTNQLDAISIAMQISLRDKLQNSKSSLTKDAFAEALVIAELARQGYELWQQGRQIPPAQWAALLYRDIAIETYREGKIVEEMIATNKQIDKITKTKKKLKPFLEKAGSFVVGAATDTFLGIPFATRIGKGIVKKVSKITFREAQGPRGGAVFDGGEFFDITPLDLFYIYKQYGVIAKYLRNQGIMVNYPDGIQKMKRYSPERAEAIIEALFTLQPVTHFAQGRLRPNGTQVPGYNAIAYIHLKRAEWEKERRDLIKNARGRRN